MKYTKGQFLNKCLFGSLLFLSMATSPAWALPPKYGLQEWLTGKQTFVRVYDLKTKRIVWTRSYPGIDETYPDNGKFFWSSDHRAVAFGANGEPARHNKNFQECSLVVWKAGRRVQTVFYRSVPLGDYTEDITWSPHKKYLIIRRGGSGMGDANLGDMTCLDVDSQQTYQAGASVGKPLWISPHTIKFWEPNLSKQYQQGVIRASQPSHWTVPYIK